MNGLARPDSTDRQWEELLTTLKGLRGKSVPGPFVDSMMDCLLAELTRSLGDLARHAGEAEESLDAIRRQGVEGA